MLIALPDHPVPNGAVTGFLERDGGLALRFARWRTTASRALGTVVVFHGRTECIEKYYETIGDLRRRGFAVATMDWRGQGLSSRHRPGATLGHVDHFSDYLDDIHTFMHEIVLADCPPPYFALAHSMGGHLLLRYAVGGANPFDRMVLVSPMIDLAAEATGMPTLRLRWITEALSFLGFGEVSARKGGMTTVFDNNPLTSDPDRFALTAAILRENPDLAVGPPTLGWLAAAAESIALLAEPSFPARVSVPILMLIGSADKIVSVRAVEEMGLALKAGRTVVVPGARHELLMERDDLRDAMWAAFDAFIPGQSTVSVSRAAS